MIASFTTVILYTQLIVSAQAGASGTLPWTEDEVSQGFAWESRLVSFGLPDHDGDCLVEIDTDATIAADPAQDVLWAVAVPFTATDPTVKIGTVMLEKRFAITPGAYRLVFEVRLGSPDHAYRVHLAFVRGASMDFAILKRGPLGTDHVLQPVLHR